MVKPKIIMKGDASKQAILLQYYNSEKINVQITKSNNNNSIHEENKAPEITDKEITT